MCSLGEVWGSNTHDVVSTGVEPSVASRQSRTASRACTRLSAPPRFAHPINDEEPNSVRQLLDDGNRMRRLPLAAGIQRKALKKLVPNLR